MAVEYTKGRAIAGLVVNLFLPGLGTLIRGNAVASGIIQLALSVLGLVIAGSAGVVGLFGLFTLNVTQLTLGGVFGLLLYLGMWIWALVGSVDVCSKCEV